MIKIILLFIFLTTLVVYTFIYILPMKVISESKDQKKKPYTPKYRKDWERLPSLQKWLTCSKKGGLTAVRKHGSSEKHKKNALSVRNMIDPISKLKSLKTLEDKTKELELRLSMFIVEHNISLRPSDHLVQLIKSIPPEVINNLTCNRTKATALINNVIGKFSIENLISRMQNSYFSILIDELTDRSAIKHLAIVVRIMDKNQFLVRDEFAFLEPISHATANNIFDTIGFASDGTNAMFGCKHSVKTLLEEEVSGIFLIKCTCHSMELRASYAAEKLPNTVEDLIRDIYTYMELSSKRQSEYKEFQVFVDAKPQKFLQASQTRWLSLHSCVKRILEQYKALKLYFEDEHLIDNKASNIHSVLSNPFTELYLNFLDFSLPILTNVNLAFQSESPQIHLIYSKVATARQLGKCTAVLSNSSFSKTHINNFVTNCLNFYAECCHQIYKRFPLNSVHMKCLEQMSFLDPKNAKSIRSISSIAYYFEEKLKNDLNDLDIEWRQFCNHNNLNFKLDPLEFWKHINTFKNCDSSEVYPLINKLVAYLFTLSHNSACVERLFSSINLNKTKTRNQLSTKTLTGSSSDEEVLTIQRKQSTYEPTAMNTLIDLNTADFVGTSYNKSLRCKNPIIQLFTVLNSNPTMQLADISSILIDDDFNHMTSADKQVTEEANLMKL
ncbi:hypothetical protein AGLY_016890 [Aphis glycines]|uniref:DUF4371 domain-containing protein n=1 Tax=Aphis glycines TaxID=307491 RepID=A0A6G0SYH3_APHGL|nr:hypothetical protein AGLY_016890 [Aphis glycines]